MPLGSEGFLRMQPISWKDFEKSEFLVTCFILERGEVVLAEPQRQVPNGTKLA
jgi:hypothetical protein